MIEQPKLTCSPLRKSFRKTNKNDSGSRKKQIKAIDDHGKEMVESNALVLKNNYDAENKLLLKEKEV